MGYKLTLQVLPAHWKLQSLSDASMIVDR